MLTTPERIRELIGLSPEEVSDEQLIPYIKKAQERFLNDIALYVRDDTLKGNINGKNTKFTLSYTNVADRTFDNKVTVADIDVYTWTDADNPETRSEVPLSSINPIYGIVTLTTAPSKDVEKLTANYYYYPREIDTKLVSHAVSALAGFYYVMAEYLLIPERLSHGAYRFTHARPYMFLLEEYYRIKDLMLASLAKKGEHKEPELIRSEFE